MDSRKTLESRDAYAVEWLCTDRRLTKDMLDKQHNKPRDYVPAYADSNYYTWGQIGNHNIVIMTLMGPRMIGKEQRHKVIAFQMVSAFPGIRLFIIVGNEENGDNETEILQSEDWTIAFPDGGLSE